MISVHFNALIQTESDNIKQTHTRAYLPVVKIREWLMVVFKYQRHYISLI